MTEKNKKRELMTLGERFNDFSSKHPKIRKFNDTIDYLYQKFMIAYFIVCIVPVAFFMLFIYFSLPDEIRNEVTVLGGGIFSLMIFPLVHNNMAHKSARKFELFLKNQEHYIKLSEVLTIVSALGIDNNDKFVEILKKYITENYSIICVIFPSRLIGYIINLYKESQLENGRGNSIYYIQKSFELIRRQSDVYGEFFVSGVAIKMINQLQAVEK